MNYSNPLPSPSIPDAPAPDPHLLHLIRTTITTPWLYPAMERLLGYILEINMPGWANTHQSREKLHTALTNARCEPNPIAAAAKNIHRTGQLDASVSSVFQGVFAPAEDGDEVFSMGDSPNSGDAKHADR